MDTQMLKHYIITIVHPLIGNVSWVWTVMRQVSFAPVWK